MTPLLDLGLGGSMRPTLAQQLTRKLKRAVFRRGLSFREVAQRSRLHLRTVQRCLNEETASLETIDTIAQALRVTLVEEDER